MVSTAVGAAVVEMNDRLDTVFNSAAVQNNVMAVNPVGVCFCLVLFMTPKCGTGMDTNKLFVRCSISCHYVITVNLTLACPTFRVPLILLYICKGVSFISCPV